MAQLLFGIAVGMAIMLIAFLGWAVCRVAGEADRLEEQAWQRRQEKPLWLHRNVPPEA